MRSVQNAHVLTSSFKSTPVDNEPNHACTSSLRFNTGAGSRTKSGSRQPSESSHLVELEELLLWLVSLVSKAVVAEGIGPLEHAAAIHNLGPGISHKLELAGGCGCDLTQVLQLVIDDFV